MKAANSMTDNTSEAINRGNNLVVIAFFILMVVEVVILYRTRKSTTG